ncbi:protein O-mannosyl-transferase TMTC2-like [Aphis craccivora]|uniref:Protein O-mannosyl-transferase TMTC2-like n=1 Tax=Aphis craccivora TaxID=307492 RepID=A0A6G0ZIE1_APHCR|nr:protein O-mannosyl-transferase TMTC2-like [Aphis craccivora]
MALSAEQRKTGALGQKKIMREIRFCLRRTDASSHSNLGAMLHLNGKHREALSSYQNALRISPDDQTTLDNLNKLRNVLRRRSRAARERRTKRVERRRLMVIFSEDHPPENRRETDIVARPSAGKHVFRDFPKHKKKNHRLCFLAKDIRDNRYEVPALSANRNIDNATM